MGQGGKTPAQGVSTALSTGESTWAQTKSTALSTCLSTWVNQAGSDWSGLVHCIGGLGCVWWLLRNLRVLN